jgi:hypothetical protein
MYIGNYNINKCTFWRMLKKVTEIFDQQNIYFIFNEYSACSRTTIDIRVVELHTRRAATLKNQYRRPASEVNSLQHEFFS